MQLVELQRSIIGTDADVSVYAVSYDSVATLAAFAEKHEITFPLLSDQGSAAITRLGMLNTQLVEERAFWGRTTEEKHYGLPFPGTFLLDGDGVVVEKVFERSHRIRAGGGVLLERLGIDSEIAGGALATAEGPAVAVAASIDTPQYFPNQIIRLRVRIAVESGFHLYVAPNADGFTNLAVDIVAPDGVFVLGGDLPEGHRFEVEGFDEVFNVVEGDIAVAISFYILEDKESVTLPVTVSYQACSATECLPPDRVDLEFHLEEIRA